MTETQEPTPPQLPKGSDQPGSPLDPFLVQLLERIASNADRLNPTRGHVELARLTGFNPSFVEALIVSARTRGLLQTVHVQGSRGRVAFQLSSRGRAWLAQHQEAEEPK
jgi:hypothetical protein